MRVLRWFAVMGLGTLSALAQSAPTGWTVFPTGQDEPGAAIQCAGYGDAFKQTHTVALQDGEIVFGGWKRPSIPKPELPEGVQKLPGMLGYQTTLRVAGGVLLGFDAGEWGGGLFFVADGTTAATSLLAANVQAILPTAQGVMVLSGVAHITIDRGVAYLASADEQGNWRLGPAVDLGEAPIVAARETASTFLVTTTKRLLRLTDAGVVEEVGKLPKSLGKNSMAIDRSGVVYVGMPFFVFRFVPRGAGYMAEALVPDSCRMRMTTGSSGEHYCGCEK